jgi:hypothetical protein
MKRVLLILAALALGAFAQEPLPLEKAQKGARLLNQSLTQTSDLPLTIEADLEKPSAFKSGDVAVLAVPDKHLTAETLSAAKEAVIPVGQLWMRQLVPRIGGQPVAADKLRTVLVHSEEKDMRVQLYLLGVSRNAQGALELVVFAQDKEPLMRVPLAAGIGAAQELPLEISGHKEDDSSGLLTIYILGQHKAEMILQKLEN